MTHTILSIDAVVVVFAVDDSVEIVRDASSRIIDFIEEISSRVTFEVGGVRHRFQRYHPYFGEQTEQTWYLDERWEEDVKYCGQCVLEKALFFAHADCWRVTERYGIDATRLYRFAVQTQPLIPCISDKPHGRIWRFFDHVGNLNSETPLGKLLVEISRRLPPELQENTMAFLQQAAWDKVRNICMNATDYEIMQKAGEVLLTRLAAVESLTVPVLKCIPAKSPGPDLQPSRSRVSPQDPGLVGDDSVKALSIRVQNLFRRTYISKIVVDQAGDGILSIPVSPRQITGLRFALGRFGLCALRILYDGGSKSAWLGDTSGCWFGNIAGTRLRDLHTTADVRPLLSYMNILPHFVIT